MATGEFAGKVAIVTGAGQNIGRATALLLAKGGAAVAVNTRKSRENADKVVQEIRAAGGQAELFMADVADAAQVNAMVEGVVMTTPDFAINSPAVGIFADSGSKTSTFCGAFHCPL